ncbi:hypothetical protein SAMN05443246_1608 [Paenibacillus sp. GP183]|nr:hypothetical protein SAMN05443246_1608 [Paenibacillus sp. GP183]
MLWLALVVFVLLLLFTFVRLWKREGMAQAMLNLISMVSFYFAFFNPLNNTVNETIFLPALFMGILSVTVSFIFWQRDKKRKPK